MRLPDRHPVLLALSLSFAALPAAARPAAPPEPPEAILRDVSALDSGGNPATMIVWGDAEALCVAPDGRVFAAAAPLGRGRVVVVGHGGFVRTDDADADVFTANAIEWLAHRGRSAGRDSGRPIRVHALPEPAAGVLTDRGTAHQRVGGPPRSIDLDAVDVVVGSPQAFARAGRLAELERWIRGGGGMLVTETAWGVLQLNPTLTVDSLAANQLLEPAGVRFTTEASTAFGADGDYPVDPLLLPFGNADRSLAVLAGERDGDPELAARVVGSALRSVPLDAPVIRRAEHVEDTHRDRLDQAYRSMATRRITPANDPLARAMIDLDSRRGQELPPRRLDTHPSSVAFPGPVGESRTGRVSIELDASVPGWHTTGLYAPPGEVVRVRVPEALVDAGAHVQIGAWRDPHRHGHRSRLPQALRRYPIDAPRLEVASSIGGPIYIDLPVERVGRPAPEESAGLVVEVIGAAEAPHYRHGVTDLEEWRTTIRHRAAPWAELESDELIFTVPSGVVRTLDRPDLVMDHWDRVHEAMQSLEPRTDNHWADRPYRYVADVSVSHGYMYCPANGPVVIPVKAAPALAQLEHFDADGPNRLWGHYHEMGHAHQHPRWTDRATTEVTVNIFTVYALHVVNGYPLDSEVMRSAPDEAWETFERHRATGEPYEKVGGPFPRLQMYALLWHAFGFEAFHETFDRIRALPPDEAPSTTTEERNAFLVHFSESVETSLVPYAEAWGIEVTDDTRERLRALPTWMPTPPERG